MTNKEAVELIYTNFFKKKEEIIPIVHKYDKSVGINFLDQPIERRLRSAKDAVTPWQFNYILRGGWQNMKERYQAIRSYNNCDLLAATIAVFQILRLDHSVDFSWICNELKSFDDSLIWSKADLHYLVEKMIVLSDEDVHIVHMESAKVIIAMFFQDGEKNKQQILSCFIERAFIEKNFSPLGLVWLCNGARSYNMDEYFITQTMIDSALNEICDISSSEKRMSIIYFLQKVFNFRYERNGEYYFFKHKRLILEWIQNADSKTAYAYSQLINTLINTDIKQHRKFAREIKPNLYSWGELYNRLTYSLSKTEYLLVGKMLESAIEKFSRDASYSTIEDLTCFLCSVILLIQSIFIKQWKSWFLFMPLTSKETCHRQFIYLISIS